MKKTIFGLTILTLMSAGCVIARPNPLEVIFETGDTNNDGQISEQEWQAASLERFKLLDTDQNGTISNEEMKAGKSTMKSRFKTLRSKE